MLNEQAMMEVYRIAYSAHAAILREENANGDPERQYPPEEIHFQSHAVGLKAVADVAVWSSRADLGYEYGVRSENGGVHGGSEVSVYKLAASEVWPEFKTVVRRLKAGDWEEVS